MMEQVIKEQISSSFVETLVERVKDEIIRGEGEICIVFPNKRAGLFFRESLSKKITNPIWSPAIVSIKEFITKQSEYNLADRLSLVIRLYDVFRKHLEQNESFDRFFPWGEMLLKDFDLLDKYLVNAEDLFNYIKEYKNIETTFQHLDSEQIESLKYFWESINVSRYSNEKKSFEDLWSALFNIYKDFKKELKEEKIAYDGMASREVAENPDKLKIPFKQVIFAGFNSLNKCEEKIFQYLTDQDLAQIYWDADKYYYENERQEAGKYIRQYHKQFKNSHLLLTDSFSSQEKNITVTGVALNIGQVKAIGQILNEKVLEYIPEKTAVILAEEDLLIPLLSSIPSKVEEVNITMGYPLRNTLLYSLFESIVDLQSSNIEGNGFFYKQVINIINHPYIFNIDPHRSSSLIKNAQKNNVLFFTLEDLNSEENPKAYSILFRKVNTISEAIEYYNGILSLLQKQFSKDEKEHNLDREYLYHFYTNLKRLQEVLSEVKTEISLSTFWKLFRKLTEGVTIPFSGEPLKGLQIMGMLETRNLDFENIFILSLNEGVFPPAPSSGSFIPFTLRKGFGLPTPEHEDAINAYYFYRLLQRGKNIHLFYNTEADATGAKEKSRFINQLLIESGLPIKEKVLVNEVKIDNPVAIKVDKSKEVLSQLDRFLLIEGQKTNRLSPSAISSYLDCKLKFYFRYVANIYEPEEVRDEVDAGVFGNLLHDVMQHLYEKLIARKGFSLIEKEDFAGLKAEVNDEKILVEAFCKHFNYKSFKIEGRNLLIKEVIKKFSLKILELDEAYAPFEIIGLEIESEGDFEIVLNDRAVKIGLKGKIDRIDKKGDLVRIIDYKSGSVNTKFADINSLFSEDIKEQNKTASQGLFYGMLYKEKNPDEKCSVGIYSTREIFSESFDSRLVMKKGREEASVLNDVSSCLPEYKTELKNFFEQLFSAEIPFTQTDEIKSCRNCAYNKICQRK